MRPSVIERSSKGTGTPYGIVGQCRRPTRPNSEHTVTAALSHKGPRLVAAEKESSISLHSIGSTYQSRGTKKSLSDRIYHWETQAHTHRLRQSVRQGKERSVMMAPEMRCDLTCLMTITDVLLFWLLLLLLLLATGITPPEHPYFACA